MTIDFSAAAYADVAAWQEHMDKIMSDGDPVAGVGEQAYIADGAALGGPGVRFFAYAGGQNLGVAITGDGEQAQLRAAAESLVRLMVDGA